MESNAFQDEQQLVRLFLRFAIKKGMFSISFLEIEKLLGGTLIDIFHELIPGFQITGGYGQRIVIIPRDANL